MTSSFFYSIHKSFCLAKTLFKSELKSKHRESFLGYAWVLAPALILTASFYFASESNIISSKNVGLPYPVYAFSGIIFWQLFSETILLFSQGMAKSKTLMLRLKIDTDAIVLSKFYEVLFDFSLKFVALLVLLFFYKIEFHATLLLLPLGLIPILLLGINCALIISPFSLLIQDLNRLLPTIMGFGLFLTPVFYSSPSGRFAFIVNMNPMTRLVTFNRSLIEGSFYVDTYLIVLFSLISIILPFSYRLHKLSIPRVIERLGN